MGLIKEPVVQRVLSYINDERFDGIIRFKNLTNYGYKLIFYFEYISNNTIENFDFIVMNLDEFTNKYYNNEIIELIYNNDENDESYSYKIKRNNIQLMYGTELKNILIWDLNDLPEMDYFSTEIEVYSKIKLKLPSSEDINEVYNRYKNSSIKLCLCVYSNERTNIINHDMIDIFIKALLN